MNDCQFSSRKFKSDIAYIDDRQQEALHYEALRIRLATYHYKPQFDDPGPQHLGFIIEDDPRSPAVKQGFDRVDMYGYVSMVLATVQEQEKEIAGLRRELEESRPAACSAAGASGDGRQVQR
jgi:hypothetical protein